MQLAAYKALLAAVLTPLPHRSVHLPNALRLFRLGLRDCCAPMAEFCALVSRSVPAERNQCDGVHRLPERACTSFHPCSQLTALVSICGCRP